MSTSKIGHFVIEPSPENPGWLTFDLDITDSFNGVVLGPMLVRRESDIACRLRFTPGRHIRNLRGFVHGGGLLGFIDVSLFAALRIVGGGDAAGGTTIDLATQFQRGAEVDKPLDALVEILRETGQLVFVRGVLEQDGNAVAAYHGTIRKPGRPL